MKEKETLNTNDYIALANIVGWAVDELQKAIPSDDETSKYMLETYIQLHNKLKRINSQNIPNVSDIIKKMNKGK